MSFNGSGVFAINTTGQPVVSGTTISAAVFNAFTADVATGLSTCILKDGTQTATAGIGFYAGTVSLPGIYFGTDTATGFYRIGLNNDGFAVNGTKLLDLGTTVFGVTGSITATTTITATGDIAVNGGDLTTTATTFNLLAGATTSLVIGGGATSVTSFPGTLEATGTTGAVTHAGGIYVAKTANIAGALTVGTTLNITGTSTLAAVNASGLFTRGANSSGNPGLQIGPTTTGFYEGIFGAAITSYTLGNSAFNVNTSGAAVTVNAITGGNIYQSINNVPVTQANAAGLVVTGDLSATGTAINFVTSAAVLTVGVGANNGTVSAGTFTDRTKFFEGDALAQIESIAGADGEIDHDTLPAFVRTIVKRPIMGDVERDVEKEVDGEIVIETVTERKQVGEEDAVERDLGAMISMLTVAVQQLTARIAALESAK